MRLFFPILIIVAALTGLYASSTLPDWQWAGEISAVGLLIGVAMLAALLVLSVLRALFRAMGGRKPARDDSREVLLVDGSNVMHWKDNTPQIETLREVVYFLTDQGYRVGVMFDANAGYKLFDRYHHDRQFAGLLSLPQRDVMVVPKGTPADPYLLRAARDMGARIVTNDRFRDWADDYPEVAEHGHLVYGGYRDDKLWLNLTQRIKGAA